ncbi:hypothetical protein EKK58_03770 [Candidatus Dependentiae bacterium]|nr:MAG: hypothetical protein EKK58_03770 [Candidatus Dependentiae bacterium]
MYNFKKYIFLSLIVSINTVLPNNDNPNTYKETINKQEPAANHEQNTFKKDVALQFKTVQDALIQTNKQISIVARYINKAFESNEKQFSDIETRVKKIENTLPSFVTNNNFNSAINNVHEQLEARPTKEWVNSTVNKIEEEVIKKTNQKLNDLPTKEFLEKKFKEEREKTSSALEKINQHLANITPKKTEPEKLSIIPISEYDGQYVTKTYHDIYVTQVNEALKKVMDQQDHTTWSTRTSTLDYLKKNLNLTSLCVAVLTVIIVYDKAQGIRSKFKFKFSN